MFDHKISLRTLFLVLSFACQMTSGAFAQTIQEHYEAAEKYLRDEKYNEALNELEQALQINPNMAEIYNLLGIVYLRQNKSLDSALGSFRESIRINPDYAEPYYNLAVTYAGVLNNTELAEEYFLKVVEKDPDYGMAYLGLGWINLFAKNDPERSIGYFENAIEKTNNQPEAYFGLGMAYYTLGKFERMLMPISTLKHLKRNDLALNLEALLHEQQNQFNLETGTETS